MRQTDTKRRRTLVAVLLLFVALLFVGAYLIFLRQPRPSEPPSPDAAVVPAPADATAPRPDAPRAADAALPDASKRSHSGRKQQGTTDEPAVASAPKPDTAPPPPDTAPPPPDAAPPDARREADARRFEALPPWPKLPKQKPARVVMRHLNRMGSSFVLIKLIYDIDGRQVFERSDAAGKLDRTRELDVFTGTLPPGRHTLAVTAVYRGAAHGLFKYHERYRYRVRSEYVFTANPGHRTQVVVKAVERGGASTNLADKPSLNFSHRSNPDR